jgi:hypothetical protein
MAYRLIWFQHFHKAAGSSIVDAARDNSEVLYTREVNGNPVAASGEQIQLWTYRAAQLKDFVDHCQHSGVTFVACEWGLADIAALASDPRVVLITCLREPLARFVSNYYYDLHNGYTPARTLEEYVGSRQRAFTMDNYYCRILSGHGNQATAISQHEYSLARRRLADFDCCINLADGFTQLTEHLGWQPLTQHSNFGKTEARVFLSRLLRLRWHLLYLNLRYRRKSPPAAFVECFTKNNQWDIRLIEELASLTH